MSSHPRDEPSVATGRDAARALLEGVRLPLVRAAFYADAGAFLRPVHLAARSPLHCMGPPPGSPSAAELWSADRETIGAAQEVMKEVLDRNLSLKYWFTARRLGPRKVMSSKRNHPLCCACRASFGLFRAREMQSALTRRLRQLPCCPVPQGAIEDGDSLSDATLFFDLAPSRPEFVTPAADDLDPEIRRTRGRPPEGSRELLVVDTLDPEMRAVLAAADGVLPRGGAENPITKVGFIAQWVVRLLCVFPSLALRARPAALRRSPAAC